MDEGRLQTLVITKLMMMMMMMTMMLVIKMVKRKATRDRISVYPTVEKGYQLLSKALSLDNAIQKISLT